MYRLKVSREIIPAYERPAFADKGNTEDGPEGFLRGILIIFERPDAFVSMGERDGL